MTTGLSEPGFPLNLALLLRLLSAVSRLASTVSTSVASAVRTVLRARQISGPASLAGRG